MFSRRIIFKPLSIQQLSIFSGTNKIKPDELSTNKAALRQELNLCRKEIKKSKRWNIMPSPKCFERAAMLYRQTKNYENEIKICQLYINLVEENLSKRKFKKKKVESKASSLCTPLSTRLNNAKNLLDNQGVDVEYL